MASLFLAQACGSGGGDSISQAEAQTATNRYLSTTLGLFTGTTEPQQFVDLFAPECREDVDIQSLAMVSVFIQGMAPQLQGLVIEDVDAGELELEQDDRGTLVLPKDPGALTVKVNGAVVSASEFFADAGFEMGGGDTADPLLLVRRDGDVFLGDCSELHDLAGGVESSRRLVFERAASA